MCLSRVYQRGRCTGGRQTYCITDPDGTPCRRISVWDSSFTCKWCLGAIRQVLHQHIRLCRCSWWWQQGALNREENFRVGVNSLLSSNSHGGPKNLLTNQRQSEQDGSGEPRRGRDVRKWKKNIQSNLRTWLEVMLKFTILGQVQLLQPLFPGTALHVFIFLFYFNFEIIHLTDLTFSS